MISALCKLSCIALLFIFAEVKAMESTFASIGTTMRALAQKLCAKKPIDYNKMLIKSAYTGNIKQAQKALDNGADINTVSSFTIKSFDHPRENVTALYRAACLGHTDFVRFLLHQGASTTVQDSQGQTVLHVISYWYPKLEMIKLLLEKKACITIADKEHSTPLHEAVWTNNSSVIELLLKAGASTQAKDILQRTPLKVVIRIIGWKTSLETIRLLLEYKSTLSKKDFAFYAFCDTSVLIKHILLGNTHAVHRFLSLQQVGPRDVSNVKDGFGMTALMWSAVRSNASVVKSLLEHSDEDSDIIHATITNNKNETALMLAQKHQRDTIAIILYKHFKKIRILCARELSDIFPPVVGQLIAEYIFGGLNCT